MTFPNPFMVRPHSPHVAYPRTPCATQVTKERFDVLKGHAAANDQRTVEIALVGVHLREQAICDEQRAKHFSCLRFAWLILRKGLYAPKRGRRCH